MSRLEETNSLKKIMDKLNESGITVDYKVAITVILLDIAKSLSMIADKLCGAE